MSYGEGDLHARVEQLESLVRDMYTANRKLRDEIDRDRCIAGPDVKCRADEVMAWLDEIVDERRMRELGITGGEES